jgi:hypothetical protein
MRRCGGGGGDGGDADVGVAELGGCRAVHRLRCPRREGVRGGDHRLLPSLYAQCQAEHHESVRSRARPGSSPELKPAALDTFVSAPFDWLRSGPVPKATADAIASFLCKEAHIQGTTQAQA